MYNILHDILTNSRCAIVLPLSIIKLAITLCLLLSPTVLAAPPPPLSKRQQSSPSPSPSPSTSDDGNGEKKGVGAQVWVPIVVVSVILLGVALLSWSQRGWRFSLGNWSTAAALAAGTAVPAATDRNTTRELTAELLANGNSPAATPATTTAANNRTRRARRNNRRTASMISTRSLPMYMKEPGEEELVIYRGPTDMEDMPVVQERATDSPDSSINLSRTHTREYGAMPDSPHDMPLLSPDDFNPDADLSGQTLIPPTNLEQLHNRPSFETLMSTTDSDGRDGQSHSDNIPEPTGEAPPYFEVVAMDELNATISRDTQPDEPAPPQPTEAAETVRSRHTQQPSNGSRRRSIFGFLHRNGAASPPPVPNNQNSSSHARTDSSPSMLSIASTSGDGHSRNRSRSNHRPSHSTSNNSVFSLGSTPFRTLSRQRSNAALDNHLNSASMISLDSISAPLTHTLVRTEFTYPKSGPTPEQLKLISSRETFAKFGVPYGRDAIAFHASQSRVDLAPPPAFDDAVAGPSSGPNASGSGVSDQQDSSHSSPLSAAPANASGDVDVAISDSETSDTVADRPSAQVPTPPSEPATGSQSTTGNVDRPAEQIPLPPSPAKSELLSAPHPPPGLSPPPPSGTAPPSSFRLPTGVTNPRSESRASSYLSFATADESFRSASPPASPSSSSHLPQLVIPTTGDDSASVRGIGEVEVSPATTAPSTPRLTSTRHLQEDTDATLTPSTPTGAKTSAIPVH